MDQTKMLELIELNKMHINACIAAASAKVPFSYRIGMGRGWKTYND